uniref:Uncharacterized protein n=1 Tax=Rhizophora mucronata TaxID=61149 RepID=A0A2P2IXB3_RHIMU
MQHISERCKCQYFTINNENLIQASWMLQNLSNGCPQTNPIQRA